MFSATVISGNRARFWKMSAVGRRLGPIPASVRPARRISPSVGSMNPEIIRRIVVFPQPLGPRKLKNSPWGIVTDACETAARSPNFLVTRSSSRSLRMAGSAPPHGVASASGPVAAARDEAPRTGRLVAKGSRLRGLQLGGELLPLGDEPGLLLELEPQLLEGVPGVSLLEVALVVGVRELLRPGHDAVVARVDGEQPAVLRLQHPVDERVRLLEVLRALAERDAVDPGQRAFLGRQVLHRMSLVPHGVDRPVPGHADHAPLLQEAGLGLGRARPPLADLLLV